MALTVSACAPSASGELGVQLQEPSPAAIAVQPGAVSPSTWTLMVELGSAVPWMLGVWVASTWPGRGSSRVGAAGATASTVKARQAEGEELLVAASVAIASTECGPEVNGCEGVQL